MGHATRCISIIKELERQGATIFIASDGRALDLLKKEFPHVAFFQLPAYNITYHPKKFTAHIVFQLPKLLFSVLKEYLFLKKIIKANEINGVISDNRLGCFSIKIPSVFITHQINLILPNKVLQWFARQLNYFFIKRYNECWVPDVEGENNMSGILSHDTPFNTVKYIGALTRMEYYDVEKKYDAIAVFSGPEPQRTIFEKKIIQQAQQMDCTFLIVQGKTENSKKHYLSDKIRMVSSLDSEKLNREILSADLFIGRTGYSTLMDLAKLGKPALLVPTPGQTEQEYLGDQLIKNDIFLIKKQDELNLKRDIPIALNKNNLNGFFFDNRKLEQTIIDFVNSC